MSDFTFSYDEPKRTATITITKTGESTKVSDINREQADKWEKVWAAEFVKRGFRMHTPSVDMTRDEQP